MVASVTGLYMLYRVFIILGAGLRVALIQVRGGVPCTGSSCLHHPRGGALIHVRGGGVGVKRLRRSCY